MQAAGMEQAASDLAPIVEGARDPAASVPVEESGA